MPQILEQMTYPLQSKNVTDVLDCLPLIQQQNRLIAMLPFGTEHLLVARAAPPPSRTNPNVVGGTTQTINQRITFNYAQT